jgi:proton glutamate symport protein
MPASIELHARKKVRYAAMAASAGVVLWVAGAAAGLAGASALGIVLRSIGILSFLGIAVRKNTLTLWTFLAVLAGVELGHDAPRFAAQTRLLSDMFLRLIRMIVAPLLFATITTGIAGHSHLRSVGRVALKALIFFEVVTTLGMIIGAAAMNLSGAGWSIQLPPASQSLPVAVQPVRTWKQTVLNLFPENIAQATAENQILQVAIFSFLFGIALALLPESNRAPMIAVLRSLADTMFRLTGIIMYLAPLAAGAAIAYTVGSMGLGTLMPLGKLVLVFYGTLVVFSLFILVPILMAFRIPLRRFFNAVAEPAAIGFATTASEAALPLAMERMEEFGVPRWIVAFVIPAGYSFNMTGSSLYLSMAAVFAAQASGIHLTLLQQVGMLATLTLASKGVAGVPRAVLVVLLATASAIHLSTAPILLILGVDAIMDMGRTMLNVAGNCMASVVVARWEGELIDPSLPDSA